MSKSDQAANHPGGSTRVYFLPIDGASAAFYAQILSAPHKGNDTLSTVVGHKLACNNYLFPAAAIRPGGGKLNDASSYALPVTDRLCTATPHLCVLHVLFFQTDSVRLRAHTANAHNAIDDQQLVVPVS